MRTNGSIYDVGSRVYSHPARLHSDVVPQAHGYLHVYGYSSVIGDVVFSGGGGG